MLWITVFPQTTVVGWELKFLRTQAAGAESEIENLTRLKVETELLIFKIPPKEEKPTAGWLHQRISHLQND